MHFQLLSNVIWALLKNYSEKSVIPKNVLQNEGIFWKKEICWENSAS